MDSNTPIVKKILLQQQNYSRLLRRRPYCPHQAAAADARLQQ
jgi:hypothetical protein